MPSTRRRFLGGTATAGTVALAGCSAVSGLVGGDGLAENPPESVGTGWRPPGTQWTRPGRGPHNARHAPAAAGPADADVDWTLERDSPEFDTRVLVRAATDEAVYYTFWSERTDGHALVAVDATDGSERWRATLADSCYETASLDGTLYAVVNDVGVVAVDASDGRRAWQADLRERLDGSVPGRVLADFGTLGVVPTPDTVYVASSYGVHGLAPGDGSEQWRVALGDGRTVDTAVTVGFDAVYPVAGADGRLYALTADRTAKPAVSLGTFVDPPALAAGRLSFALGEDGPLAWSAPATSLLTTRSGDGTVPSYDDGMIDGRWTFERQDVDRITDRNGGTAVATDGARLYVTETARRPTTVLASLICVDGATGERVWRRDHPVADVTESVDVEMGRRITPPAVGRDAVYVGLTTAAAYETAGQVLRPTANEVRAFDPDDGTEQWAVEVPVSPRNIAVAGDRLYVWDGDGRVVAVR